MQPNYRITEQILNLVQEISALTTQLAIEQRELHLRKENRIRSIQSSLAIENNTLSLEQVTAIIEGKRVLGPQKDIHEVQNAYEAYEQVFQLNPYSVADFLLTHGWLTRDLVKYSGQFRLGEVGVYDSNGSVVHIGARSQFVPNLITELFQWAEKSEVTALVKSCVVHFEIEIIHPFEDGNGRMGRLWQSLILSQWNPIFEWVPIESVIYANQQGYYDALAISNTTNDSTIFIEFMLRAILETLKEYQERTERQNDVKVHATLTPREFDIYQRIKTYLEEYQHINNYQATILLDLSAASVRRYLSLFVAKGVLIKSGTRKAVLYWLPQ